MSTITREFTKEQLIEHIKGRKEFADECAADSTLHPERREYYELTAEALRIALASLEAEERADPVAFINGVWTLVYYRPPKELGLKIGDKLYTAPPAPVSMTIPPEKPHTDGPLADGWNACRAAMLQGAENTESPTTMQAAPARYSSPKNAESTSGNSPVILDCSCRTCRPVTFNDSRFVVCPECGNKRCPRANDHRNACTGSNEPAQEGSAYPAAPHQKV